MPFDQFRTLSETLNGCLKIFDAAPVQLLSGTNNRSSSERRVSYVLTVSLAEKISAPSVEELTFPFWQTHRMHIVSTSDLCIPFVTRHKCLLTRPCELEFSGIGSSWIFFGMVSPPCWVRKYHADTQCQLAFIPVQLLGRTSNAYL